MKVLSTPKTGGVDDARRLLGVVLSQPSADVIDAVQAARGRPLTVVDFDPSEYPEHPCGAWHEFDDHDVVLITGNVSGFHRDHILLHELSHMVLGHTQPAAELSWVQAVAPDLSPSLIRQILGRTAYSHPQERDAETLASNILSASRGSHRKAWIHDPALRRIAKTLGGGRI